MVDSILTDNPFAALTSIVAPAVLTNACSVLSLGTGNRIARVVDQSRATARELREAAHGAEVHAELEDQMRRLSARSQMLISALRLFYVSLGAFATAALIAVIGAGASTFAPEWLGRAVAAIGLAAGVVGVGCLVSGCAKLVREVQLALNQTAEWAARALTPPT